uniref:Putative mitochondrial fatty acid anion carrier protein/uncoupling protein n=1 Tax=Ixodes ricinus TaxID=34613 RepID=A0A131Y2D6_IXORI
MAATIARIPSEPRYIDTFFHKYALSVAAAAVAETVTYPLDIVKTRLQVQGEMAAKGHAVDRRGFFKTASGIVKEEGLVKLWKGLPPAIYRHLIYSGCRMNFYEGMRDRFLKPKDGTRAPLWKCVLVGVLAGGLGQFLASPTDLVKVQMQTEGRRALMGLPPRVTNTWQALRRIASEGGIRGLWKGTTPNVYRAALVFFGAADGIRHGKTTAAAAYEPQGQLLHSFTRQWDVWARCCHARNTGRRHSNEGHEPADRRQGTRRGLHYKSPLDCLLRTVRGEGFRALYKGFFPIWARMAPWSFTFWVTYEEFRRFAGVASF